MRHQLADTVKVVTKLVCKFKSCHTPSPHTPLLHFREISSETRECDIFDLSGRIMRPPLLKHVRLENSMLEHSELGFLDSTICPVLGGVLSRMRCSQTMARTHTLLKCICSSELTVRRLSVSHCLTLL